MTLIEKVTSTQPGKFVKMGYKTDVPVKAEFAHKGYKVVKTCYVIGRVGINYKNMKCVKKHDYSFNNSNTHWDVYKYILKNNNKRYIAFYPNMNNDPISTTYTVSCPDGHVHEFLRSDPIFQDAVSNLIIPSYFRERRPVFSVNVDNVFYFDGDYFSTNNNEVR